MAGGHATTSGTVFQENVAAWLACVILSETEAAPPADLPQDDHLLDVVAESCQPIDDLKSRTAKGGQLFIQAKTTVRFSAKDEAFRSVLSQFARQVRFGYGGPRLKHRPLDFRDRLVLAVGPGTPATIKDDLRSLLSKIRPTSSRSFADAKASMSVKETKQYKTLSDALRQAWQEETNEDFDDDILLSLVKLMHVLPMDFGVDGFSKREADQLLRRVLQDPRQSDTAWTHILAAVREFSPRRTGGDRDFFRLCLADAGIAIKSPPSYLPDIAAVTAYKRERCPVLVYESFDSIITSAAQVYSALEYYSLASFHALRWEPSQLVNQPGIRDEVAAAHGVWVQYHAQPRMAYEAVPILSIEPILLLCPPESEPQVVYLHNPSALSDLVGGEASMWGQVAEHVAVVRKTALALGRPRTSSSGPKTAR